MRIRRILAAVIATAALAGLGLTGAATATAATPSPGSKVVTSDQCREGGGMVEGFNCKGGAYDGALID